VEIDLIGYFFENGGPFAVLFVWLLVYVMRKNEQREGRLHDILDKFSEKYDVVIDELREIKGRLK
jgi:hypothetical protein